MLSRHNKTTLTINPYLVCDLHFISLHISITEDTKAIIILNSPPLSETIPNKTLYLGAGSLFRLHSRGYPYSKKQSFDSSTLYKSIKDLQIILCPCLFELWNVHRNLCYSCLGCNSCIGNTIDFKSYYFFYNNKF